ncbi:hypothetical protein I4F81_007062 [Pyropia yezoensis]|uniref:Uncharacterized protein n=1 Tax=Pyropia yezoensis TaxID=2788 RepID=A0ACC3C452_PYRYE|nr:hypothetical protein I4F81_007062 [Neopyropia yezoensis]
MPRSRRSLDFSTLGRLGALFQDDSGAVQRERDVRRRVLKIFNATADDFATSAAHDDYLETIEEIVANLVAGTDVPATNARLAAHRAANEASIGAAAARRADADRAAAEALATAERSRVARLAAAHAADAAADAAAKAARDRAAREALEAMEEVDGPAARRRRAAAAKREKGERRRAERERAAKAAATGAVKVNRFLTPGADVHARARAGGWDKRVVRQRAWQELTDTLSGG